VFLEARANDPRHTCQGTVMLVASQVAPGKPQILHHPGMNDDERRQRHGTGTHTAISDLTVGQPTTVTFDYLIGTETVVTGGELLVVWRWPFDWSDLQDSAAEDTGFMDVEHLPASAAADADKPASNVTLKLRYNWIAGIEPWHHQLQVRVVSGELREGDRVRVVCSAWQAPTCAAERCRFLMLIDHLGNGTRNRLVQQPSFRVLPARPVRIAAIVESDAIVDLPVTLIVRGEDCWGNPTQLNTPLRLFARRSDGAECDLESVAFEEPAVRPVERFRLTFCEVESFQLRVVCGEFEATSNPVVVHASRPPESLFWGDLHSGQTEIGCGNGSLADSYAFARDCAGVQFITHQANDHYVTVDDWVETRKVTEQFYEPGRYVPFLGCEWSPLTKDGGDRNVFYRDDDPVLRRSDRFFREDIDDPEPDIRTAPEFHEAFRDRDVLVNIHVGGRMTNLDWYEPKIEKLCETHSTHGTVEWFFMDAINRGYRVGLTAGTDGVMGRPGADHPGRRLIRNLRNGLTAVYARELTRESLWNALQNRHCYATTGERIRVEFNVNRQPMGSELDLTIGGPEIQFRVVGTQALERVDLFRGIDILRSWTVAPSIDQSSDGTLLRILWGGTERRGTARLQRVNWDGGLTIAGGSIDVLEPVNFQSSDDAVRSVADNQIQWSSKTAGNNAAVLVRVRADASARLSFASEPASFDFTLQDALRSGIQIDAGGVNRFVRIGRPPNPSGPTDFEQSITDDAPLTGTIPYWLRVVQIDQAMAWCSPVWVTSH
jgi:hypothetical protein